MGQMKLQLVQKLIIPRLVLWWCIAVECVNVVERVAPCNSEDLEALLAIRDHFHEAELLARSWVGTECCNWPHVRCEESTNRVIALHLSNMRASLAGGASEIPGAAISKLSMLQSLMLFNNSLVGNLQLAHFSNLSMLRVLDLSLNQLGGFIQEADLFMFPKLRRLSLSDNELQGKIPSSFCRYFPMLRSLDLSGNNDLGTSSIPACLGAAGLVPHLRLLDLSFTALGGTIPASLCGLSNLKSLSLAVCHLVGEIPGCLGDLHLLQHLDLLQNYLEGHLPTQLCSLYGLRYLDLGFNSLSGPIPGCLGDLHLLKHLDLSENNYLEGHLPTQLCSLYGLRYLDLGFNSLSGPIPACFCAIQTLEGLMLDGNPFDSFSGHVGNLTRLTELSLGDWRAGSRLLVSSDFLSSFCLISNLSILLIFNVELGNSSSQATFHDFSCLFGLRNLSLLYLSSIPSLSGSIPSDITRLTQLQSLDLSANQLSGNLPSFLSSLPLLEWLVLDNNMFTGTIPSEWKKLSNLSYLSLSNNRLQIEQLPSSLSALPSLEYLALSSCGISSLPCGSLPPSLGYLDLSNNKLGKDALLCLARSPLNLWFLNLTGNPLNMDQWPARMACLGGQPYFTELYMSSCKLRGRLSSTFINAISTNVSLLDLSKNDLSGAIPWEVGSMQHLYSLDLSHNRFSGELPASLANCSALEYIHLGDNLLQGSIPPAMGRHLTDLRVLSFPRNRLSGNIISFRNCNHLELLDLSNNNLTGTLHDMQFSNLSTLRVLMLASNRLTGPILDTLGNFSPALQLIDLSHNQFSGTIPRTLPLPAFSAPSAHTVTLAQGTLYEEILVTSKGTSLDYPYMLQALVALNLQENSLYGTIPDSLGSLSNMLILNLSHNHLTGPIPPSLSNLSAIESLDLSSNLLTGSIPAQFSPALTNLEYFSVANNHLSGPIPQGKQFNTFGATSYEGNEGLCGGVNNILKPCSSPPFQTPHNNFEMPTPTSQLVLNFITAWVSLPALFLSYAFSFISVFWLLHRH